MQKVVLALLGALFLMGGAVLASPSAPMTADQVERFIASMGPANEFGDVLEAEGKTGALNVETRPRAGVEFKPYSSAVAALQAKFPADHARLADIVEPHGFTTEAWGATGDRVIIAYLAEAMDRDSPGAAQKMAAMDPSMLAMIPQAQRNEFEAMKSLLAAVSSASAEDRSLVKPHMAALDAMMDA